MKDRRYIVIGTFIMSAHLKCLAFRRGHRIVHTLKLEMSHENEYALVMNLQTYLLIQVVVRYLRLSKCDRGINIKRINRKLGRRKPSSSSPPPTTNTGVRYMLHSHIQVVFIIQPQNFRNKLFRFITTVQPNVNKNCCQNSSYLLFSFQ